MPIERNLTFYQGSTWRGTITWETAPGVPKDLTGYVFSMQVRKKYADEDTEGPYVDIDSDLKGGITVNLFTATVSIVIAGTDTAAMPKGGYVWDLEYVVGGFADKLVRGKVTVQPEVTRG